MSRLATVSDSYILCISLPSDAFQFRVTEQYNNARIFSQVIVNGLAMAHPYLKYFADEALKVSLILLRWRQSGTT